MMNKHNKIEIFFALSYMHTKINLNLFHGNSLKPCGINLDQFKTKVC